MGQSQSDTDAKNETKSDSKAVKEVTDNNENQTKNSSISIPPPCSMKSDGNLAVNWFQWKQNFEIYIKALDLDKNDERACALFLHCIGQYGRDIFNTLEITKPYTLLVLFTKFEQHCIPNTNVFLNRNLFFTTVQEENQTFDSFLEKLRQMSSSCQFGSLHNNLLLVQILSGLKNHTLKERLLQMQDLTLSDAIVQIRAAKESSHNDYNQDDTTASVCRNNLPEAVCLNYNRGESHPKRHSRSNTRFRSRECRQPNVQETLPNKDSDVQDEKLASSAVNVEKAVTSLTHNILQDDINNKSNPDKQQQFNDTSKDNYVFRNKLLPAHEKKRNVSVPRFKQVSDSNVTSNNGKCDSLENSIHLEAVNILTQHDTRIYINRLHKKKPQAVHENLVSEPKPKTSTLLCYCCGMLHKRRYCPAYGKHCARCGQRNHFAVVCKNTKQS